MTSRTIGHQTELIARDYLIAHGLQFVAANINYRFGELDLVMQDDDCLVFVEVRYRRSTAFGTPLESVTDQKRLRITRAAQAYLQQHNLWHRKNCRFDVVALTGNLAEPELQWFKNLW